MRRSPTEISDLLKFGAEFVRAINNQCKVLVRENSIFRLEIQTFFECREILSLQRELSAVSPCKVPIP